MHSKTLDSIALPKEINLYKKIYDESEDPIRKEIFTFSETAYIMNSISAFSVKAKEYYSIVYEYENKNALLTLLGMSYTAYRIYNESKTKKIHINSKDFIYIMNFINTFYQYNNPITDKSNGGIIWIYPKLEIKRFLADSIINSNYDSYYFNDVTLTKFILIISSFVNYEYINADDKAMGDIDTLNYPTLVLANINLYEKGILKLTPEGESIGVSLDLNGSEVKEKIFTEDISKLKVKIISVLKDIEGKNYSIKDFM